MFKVSGSETRIFNGKQDVGTTGGNVGGNDSPKWRSFTGQDLNIEPLEPDKNEACKGHSLGRMFQGLVECDAPNAIDVLLLKTYCQSKTRTSKVKKV